VKCRFSPIFPGFDPLSLTEHLTAKFVLIRDLLFFIMMAKVIIFQRNCFNIFIIIVNNILRENVKSKGEREAPSSPWATHLQLANLHSHLEL